GVRHIYTDVQRLAESGNDVRNHVASEPFSGIAGAPGGSSAWIAGTSVRAADGAANVSPAAARRKALRSVGADFERPPVRPGARPGDLPGPSIFGLVPPHRASLCADCHRANSV